MILIFLGLNTLWAQKKGENKSVIERVSDKSLSFTLLGYIIHSEKAKQLENVSLLKLHLSNRVRAFKAGHTFYSYTIHEISEPNRITLQDNEILDNLKLLEVYRDLFLTEEFTQRKPEEKKPLAAVKEEVSSSFSEEGFERENGAIRMSQKYKDKLLKQDLQEILMQASSAPVFVGNKITGFVIDDIVEGSIYEKAGILNGDIITHIEGRPLTSVAIAIKLIKSLKEEKNANITIKRNSNILKFSIGVE